MYAKEGGVSAKGNGPVFCTMCTEWLQVGLKLFKHISLQ